MPGTTATKVEGCRLSPQQRHVWRWQRGAVEPRLQMLVQVDGEVTAAAVRCAWRELIARYEILRTTFPRLSGMRYPLQAPAVVDPPLREHVLSAIDEGQDREIERIARHALEQPVDVEQTPPNAVDYVRVGQTRSILILTLSALCADRITIHRLIRELTVRCAESSVADSDALVPYADAADVLNEFVDESSPGVDYWRARQSIVPMRVDGIAMTLSEEGAFSPHRLSIDLEAVGGQCLVDRAAAWGVDERDVLLAVWIALVARRGDQRTVATGIGCTGRWHTELADIAGPLAKYLPIEVRVDPAEGVGDLMARVRAVVSEAEQWQDFLAPGEPGGDAAALPLLVDYDASDDRWTAGELSCAVLRRVDTIAPFTARLDCWRSSATLHATLVFDPRRVPDTLAERWAVAYAACLAQISAQPDVPVGALDVLTPGERHTLVTGFNDTSQEFAETASTLHACIEAQVDRTPDAIAVVAGIEHLSYAALDVHANRLARHLRACGVDEPATVGICLPRSAAMVVAFLGVLKAGGTYVPLDPEYPVGRLTLVIEDSRVRCVIVDETTRVLVPPEVPTLDPVRDRTMVVAQPTSRLANRGDHRSACYLLYTSGSTGRPKGVLISHGALLNHMAWMVARWPVAPDERVLQKTSFSFDASVWEFYRPLLAGTPVVLASAGAERSPDRLLADVRQHAITTLQVVPTLLRELVSHRELGRCATLRRIYCGGEALTADLCAAVSAIDRIELCNLYGPTEATIDATSWVCTQELDGRVAPLGSPIANTRVYVVDRSGNLMAIGQSGEIVIGGAGLALGYVGQPGTTAARFVPDAWSGTPGERLYRTGDLGRWDPDGTLHYMGRIDHQVKIRGYRVELGEIEAVLRGIVGVRDAAAAVRPGPERRPRLVAYVVAMAGEGPDDHALRQEMRRQLPEYMVPGSIVRLGSLPLTPNGKLDRAALPSPPQVRETRPPATAAEELLATIWARTLGVDGVGIDDNFFELGGDSIASLRVVSLAREAGLLLTPAQIFHHQTIAELAGVAGAIAHARGVSGEPDAARPVLLTPIQQGLLAESSQEGRRLAQVILLDVRHPPAALTLERAVRAVVAAHPALRFRFTRDAEGRWVQAPAPIESHRIVQHVDVSGLVASDAVVKAMAAQVQAKLDIEQGPVFHVACLHQGSKAPMRLLLTAHHLVVDGASWHIIVDDLDRAWTHAAAGESIEVLPEITGFAEWAHAVWNEAQAPTLSTEAPYWMEMSGSTGGATGSRLPIDRRDGDNTVASARSETKSLSVAATRRLSRKAADEWAAPLHEVLLAALARTVTEIAGADACTFAIERHGREGAETLGECDLSRTVGWFTVIHPLRLQVRSREGFAVTLQAVRSALQDVPRAGRGYGELRWLRVSREGSEALRDAPECAIAFNYHGRVDMMRGTEAGWALTQWLPGDLHRGQTPRSHLIEVTTWLAGDRLHVEWRYSQARHDRATIERWLSRYCRQLTYFARAPRTKSFARRQASPARAADAALGIAVDHYGLSPLQQGLLFHTLASPRQSAYTAQLHCQLEGPLQPALFRDAWQHVIDRHTALRTGFSWRTHAPVQIVWSRVPVDWGEESWEHLEPRDWSSQLRASLDRDRETPFDLSLPPLMRLRLFRATPTLHWLIWTHHHLVLDGWSLPLLVDETFRTYVALAARTAPALPPVRPYRDYVEWLARQDRDAAKAVWRRSLAGAREPTMVGRSRRRSEMGEGTAQHRLAIADDMTVTLKAIARDHQVTLATLVQGLWTAMLGRICSTTDVLYGTTVSGRPSDLSGADRMVGLFVNTVPVRAHIAPEEDLMPWLRAMQGAQADLRHYCYLPLGELQALSAVPSDRPLISTLFVYENYPYDAHALAGAGDLRVRDVQTIAPNHFPLTLHAFDRDDALLLQAVYDPHDVSSSVVERLLGGISRGLELIAQSPHRQIQEVQDVMDDRLNSPAAPAGAVAADSPPHFSATPDSIALAGSPKRPPATTEAVRELPVVVSAPAPDVDAVEWAQTQVTPLQEALLRHGGILFRGFAPPEVQRFERFASLFCTSLFARNGEHPRETIEGNVYTPVFYPPDRRLLWHNENSFDRHWPRKIWFCCVTPPLEGGETPLVDSRRVFARLSPSIRRRFEERGVMYIRNYGAGVGLNWSTVFGTNDRAEVEARCRADDVAFQWSGHRLTTWAVRPAVVRHPITGEASWFNQAQHWHISCLDPDVRAALLDMFDAPDLPRRCQFGDGTPIEDAEMEEICGVYRELETTSPWQRGDILMLDNILTAHARNAFTGVRKLLVAMGDMADYDEVSRAVSRG